MFASLSHTHYWYEVGMLKVPANWWSAGHKDGVRKHSSGRNLFAAHSVTLSAAETRMKDIL